MIKNTSMSIEKPNNPQYRSSSSSSSRELSDGPPVVDPCRFESVHLSILYDPTKIARSGFYGHSTYTASMADDHQQRQHQPHRKKSSNFVRHRNAENSQSRGFDRKASQKQPNTETP